MTADRKRNVLQKAKQGEYNLQLVEDAKKCLSSTDDVEFAQEFLKVTSTFISVSKVKQVDPDSLVKAVGLCCQKVTSCTIPAERQQIFHRQLYNVIWKLHNQEKYDLVNIAAQYLKHLTYTDNNEKTQTLMNNTLSLLRTAMLKLLNRKSSSARETLKLFLYLCCDSSAVIKVTTEAFAIAKDSYDTLEMILQEVFPRLQVLRLSDNFEDIFRWISCLTTACPADHRKSLCRSLRLINNMGQTESVRCLIAHVSMLKCSLEFTLESNSLQLIQLECAAKLVMDSRRLSPVVMAAFSVLNGPLQVCTDGSKVATVLLEVLVNSDLAMKGKEALYLDLDHRTFHMYWVTGMVPSEGPNWTELIDTLAKFGHQVRKVMEKYPVLDKECRIWSRMVGICTSVCRTVSSLKLDKTEVIAELACIFSRCITMHKDRDKYERFILRHIVSNLLKELGWKRKFRTQLDWLGMTLALDSTLPNAIVQKWADVKIQAVLEHKDVEITLLNLLQSDEILGFPIPRVDPWNYVEMEVTYLSAKDECKEACWQVVCDAKNVARTDYQRGIAASIQACYASKFSEKELWTSHNEAVKCFRKSQKEKGYEILSEIQLGLMFFNRFCDENCRVVKKQLKLVEEAEAMEEPEEEENPGEGPREKEKNHSPAFINMTVEVEIKLMDKLEQAHYWLSKALTKIKWEEMHTGMQRSVFTAVSIMPHIFDIHGILSEKLKALVLYYKVAKLMKDDSSILKAISWMLKIVPELSAALVEEGEQLAARLGKHEGIVFNVALCWRHYKLEQFVEGAEKLADLLKDVDDEELPTDAWIPLADGYYLASHYAILPASIVCPSLFKEEPVHLALTGINCVKNRFYGVRPDCDELNNYQATCMLLDLCQWIGDVSMRLANECSTATSHYLAALKISQQQFLPIRCVEALSCMCQINSKYQRGPEVECNLDVLQGILLKWNAKLVETTDADVPKPHLRTAQTSAKITSDVQFESGGTGDGPDIPVCYGRNDSSSPRFHRDLPMPYWLTSHIPSCVCQLCRHPLLYKVVVRVCCLDAGAHFIINDWKGTNAAYRRAYSLAKASLSKLEKSFNNCVRAVLSGLATSVPHVGADLKLELGETGMAYAGFLTSLGLHDAAKEICSSLRREFKVDSAHSMLALSLRLQSSEIKTLLNSTEGKDGNGKAEESDEESDWEDVDDSDDTQYDEAVIADVLAVLGVNKKSNNDGATTPEDQQAQIFIPEMTPEEMPSPETIFVPKLKPKALTFDSDDEPTANEPQPKKQTARKTRKKAAAPKTEKKMVPIDREKLGAASCLTRRMAQMKLENSPAGIIFSPEHEQCTRPPSVNRRLTRGLRKGVGRLMFSEGEDEDPPEPPPTAKVKTAKRGRPKRTNRDV